MPIPGFKFPGHETAVRNIAADFIIVAYINFKLGLNCAAFSSKNVECFPPNDARIWVWLKETFPEIVSDFMAFPLLLLYALRQIQMAKTYSFTKP